MKTNYRDRKYESSNLFGNSSSASRNLSRSQQLNSRLGTSFKKLTIDNLLYSKETKPAENQSRFEKCLSPFPEKLMKDSYLKLEQNKSRELFSNISPKKTNENPTNFQKIKSRIFCVNKFETNKTNVYLFENTTNKENRKESPEKKALESEKTRLETESKFKKTENFFFDQNNKGKKFQNRNMNTRIGISKQFGVEPKNLHCNILQKTSFLMKKVNNLDSKNFMKNGKVKTNLCLLSPSPNLSKFKIFNTKKSFLLNSNNFESNSKMSEYIKSSKNQPNIFPQRSGFRSVDRSLKRKKEGILDLVFNVRPRSTHCLYQNKAFPRRNQSLPGKILIDQQNKEKMVFGIRTRRGFDLNDCFKKNQDSYLACTQLIGSKTAHVFGICDGHGKQGEKIAEFITKNFSANFSQALKKTNLLSDKEETQKVISELENYIYFALKKTVSDLNETDLDFLYSGSTFSVIVILDNCVFCGNVGDSRAIMLRGDSVIQLSEDHKPENETEKLRIESKNGVVLRSTNFEKEEIGPFRVWMKNSNMPGLSLSRSIGDQAFENIGITWKPSFVVNKYLSGEKLVFVIGSDGLFEVLSNKEIIQIMKVHWKSRNIEEACDSLMETAMKKWKEFNYDSIDDITFIAVFSG